MTIHAKQWFKGQDLFGPLYLATDQYNVTNVYIRTLEGETLVISGDYIIRGVKGEHYTCKPDIFQATYEEA